LLVPAGASAASWNTYRKKPNEWFKSDEAKAVAANLLAWQTDRGDCPNDTDTLEPRPADDEPKQGTFDDGHTTHETRYLVRMYAVTGKAEYRDAALRAIDHVIDSQYASGGFPQRSPPGTKYPRHITFNDRTTVNLLELMRDVSRDDAFAFVGEDRRRIAGKMVESGIRCILALQVQGRHGLTAWAAQYDEETLLPAPARAFEPASLAGGESADILLFLMSLDEPGPEVLAAVDAGVNWFHIAQINGTRVVESDDDVKVVADPTAPPVWARFYDLNTLEPVFAGRDGVVKSSLAEIDKERRTGYAWYGEWGTKVFAAYAKWPYRPMAGMAPSRP
jgi:pectate lyase